MTRTLLHVLAMAVTLAAAAAAASGQDAVPPALSRFDQGATAARGQRPTSERGEREYRDAIRNLQAGQARGGDDVVLNIAVTTGGHRGDPEARFYRGRALYMKGETVEAIYEFNTALRLKPAYPAATFWHGACLRRLGLFDEALAEMDAALATGFADEDAQAMRATILYRLGRFDEALAIRDKEVLARPDDPVERLDRAELLAAMGKNDLMDRDLTWAFSRQPELKASRLPQLRRIVASREARVAAAKETRADAAMTGGNHAFWQADYVAAAEWYARAAQLDPKNVDASCGAARSYELAQVVLAHAWYANLAVRADPKHAEARKLRGWAWRNVGAYDLAEGEFNAALAIDPHYADAYLGRAQLYYQCLGNRNAAAQRDYERAVQIAPQDPNVWMARGIFLLEWAPAFMSTQGLSANQAYNPPYLDFSKVLELDPRRTKAYVYRSITAAAWGKAQAAQADLNKAIELEPWDARKNIAYVRETLADMRAADAMGRRMMQEFADGAEGRLPPAKSGDDGSAAARAKWNKETGMDNASKAGDQGAYERIKRDEGTWRDRSRYGG